MDVIFTIVGILGLGALAISVYVFLVAARRYVSDEGKHTDNALYADNNYAWQPRSGIDRRQNQEPARFPLTLGGDVVERDRRRGERRQMQVA